MPQYAYDRLTALDNSFLIAESPKSHMHIAGTAIYEAGPLRKGDGGIDVERLRAYVESRLHLIPRYRQVLASVPLEQRPVWVDDQHFNIDYHVRHTSLPRPGDVRQLKRLAGRIMSQQLDRSKPLWEMWIVEGLQGGEHFAMITKVHHCMIDGMSSVDLLAVLLTVSPMDDVEPPPRWLPRPTPEWWQLLAAETMRRVQAPLELVRGFRHALQAAGDPRSDVRVMLRAMRDMLGSGFRMVSDTPINRPIGPHRRVDWHVMSVDEVKAVKNALGGTLNDIVLTTVTGAVQRFLEGRRVNVDVLDFRVMAPVSVRSENERGTLGNRVSAWIVELPLAERDPRRRLALIRERTARLKESKQAMGAEVLTRAAEWTPSTLLSLGARMMTRALPFNIVVTNVPGPQVPLYMLGAKMLDNYGHIPLTDYLGVGIVLFSYAGKLCWGFTADWDLVPDLHEFVAAVRAPPERAPARRGPLPPSRHGRAPTQRQVSLDAGRRSRGSALVASIAPVSEC
jgi:diacylglycerol O-acyltransferase / wax synthase